MNELKKQGHYRPLMTSDFVKCPLHRMELVGLDDPATHVFSDFTHHCPAVIAADVSIAEASKKMKSIGDHLLLVVDDVSQNAESGRFSGSVIGQITSCDIIGEGPVRAARENGIRRNEVTVRMAMTPREDIRVLDWEIASKVKVGHILATMREQDSCHILVVENGELRGIFSQGEINKHLDHIDIEPIGCAQSLAELVHRIG
jgi:CBS domain containing-hemolysin-like protein